MKKILIMLLSAVFIFWSVSFANDELQEAVSWMYWKDLTSFGNVNDFNWEWELTREQASKFFVQFTKQILGKKADETKKVELKDLTKADKTLQPYIKRSNQLWLFKWSDGNFYPFNRLTRAQALAVLIRAKNWLQDEWNSKRYSKYYDIASEYGIISSLWFNFDTLDSLNIKRKEIAIMLFRLSKINNRVSSGIIASNPKPIIVEPAKPATTTVIQPIGSKITLNTTFTIEGIEYEILWIKFFDKLNNDYDWQYPKNGKWMIVEYSYKNIDNEYWYSANFKLQNGEILYDHSSKVAVYADEQMWYKQRIEPLLKWAKMNRYIWFDVDYDKIKGGDLLVLRRSDYSWNDALKIPLKNLLP